MSLRELEILDVQKNLENTFWVLTVDWNVEIYNIRQ